MIAKHVPMRSIKKSDFAELVKYITDEQGKTDPLLLTASKELKRSLAQPKGEFQHTGGRY